MGVALLDRLTQGRARPEQMLLPDEVRERGRAQPRRERRIGRDVRLLLRLGGIEQRVHGAYSLAYRTAGLPERHVEHSLGVSRPAAA